MEPRSYDVLIVGAGMAGLTAAAYLSKAGLKVLLCEKEKKIGGLVNSFEYKGFIFDGGIRAIENSGIVVPMLRQLGIEIDFLPSPGIHRHWQGCDQGFLEGKPGGLPGTIGKIVSGKQAGYCQYRPGNP